MVPVGIYYYVLKPDAAKEYIKGFVYIAYWRNYRLTELIVRYPINLSYLDEKPR